MARRRLARYPPQRAGVAACVGLSLALSGSGVSAETGWRATQLLDLRIGSSRSSLIDDVRYLGFELSDGTPVEFEPWYSSRWPDTTVQFLTPLTGNFGVTWGFSTGERGEKYTIDPGLHLGFIYQMRPSRRETVTIAVSLLLAGNLRERSCIADFGAIGGIQDVNCRLAASPLPPADTLRFLFRERGFRESRISISYMIRF